VISKRQYLILSSCADDWEVFYVPFAMVNFGGPLFPRRHGAGHAQNDDERRWSITVDAGQVAADIAALVKAGFLACHRVQPDGSVERLPVIPPAEFDVYGGYVCVTFEEHVDLFGSGPHEFKMTERGGREIEDERYRAYDRELGWA
jgi:hypothetical protein